jgi:5-deoxy-D-glucuronate isomerase
MELWVSCVGLSFMLIYVFVDGLGLDFCYVIYDQDIINVPRVKCYVLCIK